MDELKGDPVYIKIDRITGGYIDGALKTQKEIYGRAELKCELVASTAEDNPFIFPLIFIFKNIGDGFVPLGGRTSIGLGQYKCERLKISGLIENDILLSSLTGKQKDQIKKYFEAFKRWCGK